MSNRRTICFGLGLAVVLGASASIWSAAATPRARVDEFHYQQVRAEYIALAGNNDTTNTTPVPGTVATLFPAENNAWCPPAAIKAMGYDWSALSTAVDAMTPNGATNQTIGFVWGWQALSQGVPLNAEGVKAAYMWDPATDEGAGEQCRGAGRVARCRLRGGS